MEILSESGLYFFSKKQLSTMKLKTMFFKILKIGKRHNYFSINTFKKFSIVQNFKANEIINKK